MINTFYGKKQLNDATNDARAQYVRQGRVS